LVSIKPPLRLVEWVGPRGADDIGDDDLMLLASSGRQDAFEALVRRHQSLVLGLSCRFLGDKSKGRDVTQEVFLALWAERSRYRAQGRFRSFLVSMTLHRCHAVIRENKNYLRRMAELARESETTGTASRLPLERLLEWEKAQRVRQGLMKLPIKHRQVLILRFTHGYALEEISQLLDSPLGTVKSSLFRGLKKLQALLPQEHTK
jgi:RNA polymerase sigma-70 factor (ECF subfamily)